MTEAELLAAHAAAANSTTYSDRLWSEEVGMAEANQPQQPNIAYRFSSGRTFTELTYD